jgi:uncharacterized protein (TIGR02268 family)
VSAVLPAAFMTFVLSGATPAQADAITCETGVRHVELPAVPTGGLPAVCISPGRPTLFSFDVELVAGSLSLEGLDGFSLVDQGKSTLKLVPSERLTAGRRLPMTVRFKDSEAPTSAAFMLVVLATQAEPLVNVHRQVRSAESYEQELEETKAKVRQLTEENTRLRAEKGGPGGLIGLRASGIMEKGGVAAHLIPLNTPPSAATNAARVSRVTAYRSATRAAVEVVLALPEDAPPWTPASATLALQGRKGVELKVVTIWQPEPLAPGLSKKRSVFVEAEAPADVTGTFTLKLWDASGTRTVTLSGITFP